MERKTRVQAHCLEKLNKEYFEINHKSGLKAYVFPEKSFHTCYGIIGTSFGSVNSSFKLEGEESFSSVPDGIAHYLEHKLFESEDGEDTFLKYARFGACANAYTSFDRTCYLFSCSKYSKECLGVLLDSVTHPYFTDENVEKERGIIGQEIEMYNDDPFWRSSFNLLVSAYKNNPIKTDIAGSVESIKNITPENLYRCYNSFYSLNNMVLAVSGNIELEDVLEVMDENLEEKALVKVTNERFPEPEEVNKKEIRQTLPVSVPLYEIGYKGRYGYYEGKAENKIVDAILSQIIIDETTDLYNELYQKGIINNAFGADLMQGEDYSILMFAGEGDNAYEVKERIDQRINELKKNGISDEEFNRIKKILYNSTIGALSTPESVSSFFLGAGLNGVSPNELIKKSLDITKEMVYDRLITNYDTERSCVSIIDAPKEND